MREGATLKRYQTALGLWFLCGAMLAGEGLCGGIFLVGGVGLPGRLELGMERTSSSGTERKWKKDEDSGLDFKVSNGQVVLIACDKTECVTDRNVAIGTHEKVVVRRYGAPIGERPLKDKAFFWKYRGVGFRIKEEIVQTIYIFPRFSEKY